MARFKEFHSSKTKSAGDCVIRSIMACTGYTWERVFWDLCNIARKKQCMPNDKPVYDAWFKANGFKKCKVEKITDDSDYRLRFPTVYEWCQDHPGSVACLTVSGHMVGAVKGQYWDSWDCGEYKVRSFYLRELGWRQREFHTADMEIPNKL